MSDQHGASNGRAEPGAVAGGVGTGAVGTGAAGPAEPVGSTEPGATVAVPADTAPPAAPPTAPTRHAPAPSRSRVSGVWVGLILSAVVLLFLLIFILQNLDPVRIYFLGATGTLPTGVALLLGAIAGILLVAIPGSARIVQLRRTAKREAKRLR
ncbi:LapA family protein [Pseudonocardia xishanensis]|uniref:Lipopolysaccharide assembly protein A domain-containing protein n=1 Tax=Pseudonocardia xishanensis TaxID=630995 RepID=A0ABP8RXQ0_9PSEU